MSKGQELPPFPEFLADAIEEKFDSDSAFARVIGVNPSSVSKWVNGQGRPTIGKLKLISEAIGVPFEMLMAMAYPEAGAQVPATVEEPPRVHPLARDLDRMLADDSPVPQPDRARIEELVGHVIEPYRRYLRRRRAL